LKAFNRKLLVSVFNAQEAREAVLGGGRIIDSEDPRSALGNIKPRQIMAVSDAVLNFQRDLEIQLSTNIGEDQLLFDRSESGIAIEKSPYEISGKAAQAAIGVACSMGTRVHPCNIIKVGVDGMGVEMLKEVLQEVVLTLNRTEQFSHCQVMSVLFAQDMACWKERKEDQAVRNTLVELREFHPADPADPDAFDLQEYAANNLRDRDGRVMFRDPASVSLGRLIKKQVLPEGSNHSFIQLNELFDHQTFFPRQVAAGEQKTSKAVIKAMVDATADVGADMIMLDTSILSKVSGICLVDTGSSDDLIDLNQYDRSNGRERQGILNLDELRYFIDYCHYRGIEANLAGSIQSYQAQQLWVLAPEMDQASTRGAGSGVVVEPGSAAAGADSRQHRVIKRELVRGLAPPEHGGVLNIPQVVLDNGGQQTVEDLQAMISEHRKALGLPELLTYVVDRAGNSKPYSYAR
jgi:uncharacterized protein (UPF0264 family)